MEDPTADTEWNDILRKKGILPKLEKPKEEDLEEEDMSELKPDYDRMDMDELDDLEDDDEEFMTQYRAQRMQQIQALKAKNKYGEVRQITGTDYVQEVNKAGDDTWVILHLYRDGLQLCNLINHHFTSLARKFPATKFLKSVATTTIPNYPDKNLPTIFIYFEGKMKAQIIGPQTFRSDLTANILEWTFKEIGAVESFMEENPNKELRDVVTSSIRSTEHGAGLRFYGE